MANKKAAKLKSVQRNKELELIELFESMGHTQLNDAREISSLHLPELQELLKYGIKK